MSTDLCDWNVQCCMFDWNGTIVDDTVIIHEARNAVIIRYGGTPSTVDEFFESFNGNYLDFYYERGVPTTVSPECLTRAWVQEYKSRMKTLSLFPHAVEVLYHLSKTMRIGLITHNHESLVQPLLDQHCLNDVFWRKSFNEMDKSATIRSFIEREGFDPKRCYYVGDSPSDVISARHAGVKCIAFYSGSFSYEYLSRTRPFVAVRNFSQLYSCMNVIQYLQ